MREATVADEPETTRAIQTAVRAMGSGPLTEQGIAAHLRPLFTRVLAAPGIYLATHSLGRPLDAVQADLAEGVGVWQDRGVRAWDAWSDEEARYRAALARLIGAPRVDCVVPRLSAGHAVRSVLNMLPQGARVLSTEGEFAGVGVVLAQYAALGRLALTLVPEGAAGFSVAALLDAIGREARAGRPPILVVVSQVFLASGQLLGEDAALAELASGCHRAGARLLVDSYHSLGVVAIDVKPMGCDYMISGCYKYLRGGPGAAFLYLSPTVLDAGERPLDTGWFALAPGAAWWEPGGPQLREGGDAHLEGTPPVLTYYQARSGLAFTEAVGVARLRVYGLAQAAALRAMLIERGVDGTGGEGAFVTLAARDSEAVVAALAGQGIVVNARQGRLRICPECLTTTAELEAAAEALAECRAML